MTYLRDELDNICKRFCPLCGMCDVTHLCKDIKEIRKKIIDIVNQEPIDDS